MDQGPRIFLGKGTGEVFLGARFANRHGLIAGATGTGKTVTLQTLAESFSKIGVPVFMADVKGDLSGLCVPGADTGKVAERAAAMGLVDWKPQSYPCLFWDVFGDQGHPIRATVSEMGPLLFARLLELNETQAGVLHAAFAVADDEGMLLLDLKDLRAILSFLSENAANFQATYGNISGATVGAIQRKLLVLEREGGEAFLGEPALDINDLMRVDNQGRGYISILSAKVLINKPGLYSIVLLWLLSELFEELPEVGDRDRPRLVFFFDEAHLLFDGAPKALTDKIEQVVRLIRSKGVGVYFITQSPTDLPDDVLGQLGNRVQHALRAFTPKDQKAVRAAAETFRANPVISVATAITELGIGEALVSTLEDNGTPSMVERILIRPPEAQVGPASPEQRATARSLSPLIGRYDEVIDRFSAYEQLKDRALQHSQAEAEKSTKARRIPSARTPRQPPSIADVLATSAARSIGNRLGRELVRGVLGSLLRGR